MFYLTSIKLKVITVESEVMALLIKLPNIIDPAGLNNGLLSLLTYFKALMLVWLSSLKSS